MARKNNEIEKIKLFIAKMLNEEKDNHAWLITVLRGKIGKTREFDDVLRVLSQIHESKINLLEKVYNEINRK